MKLALHPAENPPMESPTATARTVAPPWLLALGPFGHASEPLGGGVSGQQFELLGLLGRVVMFGRDPLRKPWGVVMFT